MNFDVVQIEAKTVKTDVLLIFVFANQKKLDDNYLDLDFFLMRGDYWFLDLDCTEIYIRI